jgi:hypothetical protein
MEMSMERKHKILRMMLKTTIVCVMKSRGKRWAGDVALMGDGTVVYRILVGKPEGKGPVGRRRRRWEDNIKVDL